MARLGRTVHLFGIPLRIHPSWLVLLALLVLGVGHVLPADSTSTQLFDLPASAYLGGLAVALGRIGVPFAVTVPILVTVLIIVGGVVGVLLIGDPAAVVRPRLHLVDSEPHAG